MPWPWETDDEDAPQNAAARKFDPEALSPEVRSLMTRQYLPQPDEIDAVRKKQEEDSQQGLLSTILSFPEKLLFGQAIKGAVKGAAQDGFSGAVMGFLRGTPFAYLGEALTGYDLYDETRFTDIRRAFGDQDVEGGGANFALNLLGEIALSPLELMWNPFGLTKAGEAYKVAEGAKFASIGGMTGAHSVAAIKEAVEFGRRAAMVLKVPFGPVIFESNLGFKSGASLLGGFLDGIGTFVRTNPLTKGILGIFSHTVGIADPKVASFTSELISKQNALRNAAGDVARKTFAEVVTPQGQKLAFDQGYAGLLDTLHRAGIAAVDEAGSLGGVEAILSAPDVAIAAARRNAALKSDKTLSVLWDKAVDEAKEATNTMAERGVATSFPELGADATQTIRTLYDRGNVPLTDQMLKAAGLEARPALERSWTTEGSLAEQLAGAAGPGGTTLGGAIRADEASARSVGAAQSAIKARNQTLEQWNRLKAAMASGEVTAKDVDSYLTWHKDLMLKQGKAEIEVGALSELNEPFLGIYAAGIINPKTAQFINDHALAVMRKYNYSMPRNLTGLTALEANAIARDFGLKATGFVKTEEIAKYGADSVWKRIFDRPFMRRLFKEDPKAAEVFDSFASSDDFFRISPVQNAIERVQHGSERMFLKALANGAIHQDSPLVKAVFKVGELAQMPEKLQEYLAPLSEYQVVMKGAGGVRAMTRAETFADKILDPEARAAFEVTKHGIADDLWQTLRREGVDHERVIDELDRARFLHEDAIPEQLQAKEIELRGTRRIKDGIINVQESERRLADAEALRRYHVEQNTTGIQQKLSSADPAVQQAYKNLWDSMNFGEAGTLPKDTDPNELISDLLADKVKMARSERDFAKAHLDELRNAANDILDDFEQNLNALSEKYGKAKGLARLQRKETFEALKANAEDRVSLVQKMQEKGISAKRLSDELALRDEYAAKGVTALDEAKMIFPEGEGKPSLYDRIFEKADPNQQVFVVRRDDWKSFADSMTDLAKPDPYRNQPFVRFFDQVKRSWAVHTAMNPAFVQTRVRNMIQNMASSATAGLFSPGAQIEAVQEARALGAMMKGDMTLWNALAPERRELMNEALKRGVIRLSPMYATEVGLNAEQWAAKTQNPSIWQKVKDLKGIVIPEFERKDAAANVYSQWASRLETGLDNWQRLAAFKGAMKRGMSIEDAAGAVRRAMYDSQQPLTWTERTLMRRLIPFYSFQKYAFSTVADLYLHKPGALTWFDKVRKTAAESPPGLPGVPGGPAISQDDSTFLPPFIKDNLGIASRNTPQGPVYRLFGAYFPLGEVSALANALDDALGNNEAPANGQGLVRYAVSKMHPALKTLAQQIWMRDFYSDKPLEDFPGEQGEMYGVTMPKRVISILRNMRFLNELDKLNVFNASEAKAMTDAVVREKNQDRPQQDILDLVAQSAFSPLPVPQERLIDPVRESRYRQLKDEEDRRRMKGRMLRLAAAPDTMPTKEANLIQLRKDYAEETARMRRRADAAKPYLEASANPSREPRINLMR